MTAVTPRRAVLSAGARGVLATGLGVAAGVPALASCARRDPGPDELEAPLAAARADAALAGAAAAAFPDLAPRLTPVADARRAHADALAREIRRARPDRAEIVDRPSPPAGRPASGPAALAAVRDGLGRALTDGRALALRAGEPFRCGLLASVAASCAGHVTELA